MKIPFDIKYRPQIESGEYKVVTRDEHPVRIICWDRKSEGDGQPIVALVEKGHYENSIWVEENGVYKGTMGHEYDLFIVTPEPELRESEDERIRKEIRNFLIDMECKEEWIAYLEKQKENPKSADSIPSDCVSDAKCEDRSPKHSDSDGTDIRDTPAYWRGWDDAMKQKEQKHPHGCFTCDEYKKGYEAGRLNGFTAGYNKAMKEQKPAEWSEEDERMRCNILNALTPNLVYSCGKGTSTGTSMYKYDEEISWLKSLRPTTKK